MTESTKKIVILGGGYAAVAAATQLDKLLAGHADVEITLVTKNETFYHSIGSFRALVEPSFAEKICIPYTNLFQKCKNARVVQGAAVSLDRNQVTLQDGKSVPFEYLIIATGSSYPTPCKPSKHTRTESINELTTAASAIKSANNILIVGGGPVGMEIAGEISTDCPEKKVTLVHAGDALMPGPTSDKFKAKCLSSLQQRKVEVILGERVQGLEPLFPDPVEKGWYAGEKVTVKTSKGREIDADVVLLATGNARYNSAFVSSLGEDLLEAGQVKVRPTLQLANENLGHILAIGDVANLEGKLGYLAGEQGTLAANNLVKLIKSGPTAKLASYKSPSGVIAIVSLGRNGGVSQLFGLWGDTVTKMVKSKDLFVQRYWGILNAGKT